MTEGKCEEALKLEHPDLLNAPSYSCHLYLTKILQEASNLPYLTHPHSHIFIEKYDLLSLGCFRTLIYQT